MADKWYKAIFVVPCCFCRCCLFFFLLLDLIFLLLLLLLPLLGSRISNHIVHCATCTLLASVGRFLPECNQLCLTQSVLHAVSCLQVNIKAMALLT